SSRRRSHESRCASSSSHASATGSTSGSRSSSSSRSPGDFSARADRPSGDRQLERGRLDHVLFDGALVDRALDRARVLLREAGRERERDADRRKALLRLVAHGLEREAEPLGRDPALLTEAEGVEAHARRDRGEEEVERRGRGVFPVRAGLVGPNPVALHVGLDGHPAGERDGDVHAAPPAQQDAFASGRVSFTPAFLRIVIIGHHFENPLWRRFIPTKAVKRRKPGWTKYPRATEARTKNPAME